MKTPKSKQDRIIHQEKYIAFLEKAVNSNSFKTNDPEKWEQTKEKLKRERLILKMLR